MNEVGATFPSWVWIAGGTLLLVGLLVSAWLLRDDRVHGPVETARRGAAGRSREPGRPLEPTGLLNPHQGPQYSADHSQHSTTDGGVLVVRDDAGGGGLESTLTQPVGTGEPFDAAQTIDLSSPAIRTDVRLPESHSRTLFAYTTPSTHSAGAIHASARPMGTPQEALIQPPSSVMTIAQAGRSTGPRGLGRNP